MTATTPAPPAASQAAMVPAMSLTRAWAPPARLAGRYVDMLRRHHGSATPAQIVYVLDRQFLLALGLGGTGTGLLTLRRRTTPGMLGLSAAHLGASGATSVFYLLCLAHVYGLSPEGTKALVTSSALGEVDGDVIEQQFAGIWWRSALAYLPASQVSLVERIAARGLRRAERRGGISPLAAGLPVGIGLGVGYAGGRVLAGRVISAAAAHLGSPPSTFG